MASEIKVDTISEKTSAGGVTIDGLLIKDGNISGDVALAGTTPTFTIGDAGAEDAALVFDGNAKDFYVALDDSSDKLVIGEGSTVGTNSILTITDDSVTIGDAAAVDTKIVFDGNAQDFYIGLDDSADDLVIGLGSTVGTTPAISINEDRDVTIADGSIDFDIASHDTSNGLKLGGTLVTATAAELNIMDGVTATAAEINLIDGGTARGTTALADGDGVLINDNGTMRMTNVTTVKTYMAGGITEWDAWTIPDTLTLVGDGSWNTITDWERDTTDGGGSGNAFGTGMAESSGIFTFPSTGYWYIQIKGMFKGIASAALAQHIAVVTTTNSGTNYHYTGLGSGPSYATDAYSTGVATFVFDVTDVSTHLCRFDYWSTANNSLYGGSSTNAIFIRLGDT